jgi:phosphoribosylglycinamide formyltransferase-1
LNEQNNKIRTEIFSKEELNESKVLQKLKSIGPDLIVLAGFIEIPQNIIVSILIKL